MERRYRFRWSSAATASGAASRPRASPPGSTTSKRSCWTKRAAAARSAGISTRAPKFGARASPLSARAPNLGARVEIPAERAAAALFVQHDRFDVVLPGGDARGREAAPDAVAALLQRNR